MKLVIGLGNPTPAYANTRHNVGFLVVEALEKNKQIKDCILRKSDVFMNDSGTFVKKMVNQYKLSFQNLFLIHDDLDIRLGEYKIQFAKGPKDHNGVTDVENKLGTKDFWRVRIGVDNRPLDGKPLGEEYVLQDFTEDEGDILDRTIKAVVKELESKLREQ